MCSRFLICFHFLITGILIESDFHCIRHIAKIGKSIADNYITLVPSLFINCSNCFVMQRVVDNLDHILYTHYTKIMNSLFNKGSLILMLVTNGILNSADPYSWFCCGYTCNFPRSEKVKVFVELDHDQLMSVMTSFRSISKFVKAASKWSSSRKIYYWTADNGRKRNWHTIADHWGVTYITLQNMFRFRT
jgi:hypothetical protein